MQWLILVLVLSSLSLLIAAGGMVLHVRRQRQKTIQNKEAGPQVETNSNDEGLIDP